MKLDQVIYTAHAKSTGGRQGTSRTSDGYVDVKLTMPKEFGGPGGVGTNPEQLFAMGFSACFISTMKYVAALEKIHIPDDTFIDASVGIGKIGEGFNIEVELKITVPGMDRAQVQSIVDKSERVCAYSNATHGNIELKLTVV
ncbi:MAG TPA: organic hydroperoxide resistance protein [Silvibacterium sp.]|nr:organic hydroperoxide resistance protein [Silvibacterium sp.]